MHSLKDLVELYRGAPFVKRGDPRSVGVEQELLVVKPNGEMADAFSVMIPALVALGWEAHYDEAQPSLLVGAKHAQFGEVTMDAGKGTLEWVSLPRTNLWDLDRDWDQVSSLLVQIARENGLLILGTGRHPVTRGTRDTLVPKDRYTLFFERFGDIFGAFAENASHQYHIGARGPDDLLALLNDFLRLSVVFAALSANSPIYHGEAHSDRLGSRMWIWDEYAPGRVGIPARPYQSIDDLCQRMWTEEYIFGPCPDRGFKLFGQSFGAIASNGAAPTHELLRRHTAYHEGCLWEDARARFAFGTVETRTICQQPQRMKLAFTALGLGLAEMSVGRLALLNRFTWADWRRARESAAIHGFNAQIGRWSMSTLYPELFWLAEMGLQRRDQGEEELLEPLRRLIFRNQHSAGAYQLEAFHQGGPEAVVETFAFR